MEKTIVEKLNLQKYKSVAVLNLPDGADYFKQLSNFTTKIEDNEKYDLIFTFALDIKAMKEIVFEVIEKSLLLPKGYLFIAYPKKGNKVYDTFIHRDEIFPSIGVDEDGYVGDSTIKFARMVGLDEVFTVVGLKEDTKGKGVTSTKASQCVDDYIDIIPQIEKDLEDTPDLLAFYKSLTPGYQKDWARYVYSAKQEATKAKRREEMKKILSEGYKSRDLYVRKQ
ncbi:YdeI/OmpD-associated family protein [Ureibacillus acetophenoni]|uniref:Bacteriocin resistance YdeI/OmpD-like protein n=1 Tax=Ureibacillus acetophenoni TaxID=614649 RepID=A0A285UBF2_9BACL|nr:YdeI/OmpD-associated family protein [Ureibacillus acetophenoni]SOC39244.1 bacteriocin resistance YdeI/OmpD-like protein [Ureibacillus acetophenoni]